MQLNKKQDVLIFLTVLVPGLRPTRLPEHLRRRLRLRQIPPAGT
jgi:hypothetical protein